MSEYENNAFFWQKVDTIYLSSTLTYLKKKGEAHPIYKNLIYPVNYGEINANGDNGIAVYIGSAKGNKVSAMIIAADILEKELDVRLCVSCTEEEIESLLHFLNQAEAQKTVLIRRGSDIPTWSESSDNS